MGTPHLVVTPLSRSKEEAGQQKMPGKAETRQILSCLDVDDDGKISVDELLKLVKQQDSEIDFNACQTFIAQHDKDGDGNRFGRIVGLSFQLIDERSNSDFR